MTDHRLLEIVDTWFSDPKSINEGGYLEICNLLKKNFDSSPDKLKEELEEEFWDTTNLKPKGNRNSRFFAMKHNNSIHEFDRKFSGIKVDRHGNFHPKIP